MDMLSDTLWTTRPTRAAELSCEAAPRLAPPAVRHLGGTVTRRVRRSFGPVAAVLTDIKATAGIEVEIEAPTAVLSMVVEEVGGSLRFGPERADGMRQRNRAAGVTLIPPGELAFGSGDGLRVLRHLVIEVPAEACGGAIGKPRWAIDDAVLGRLCHLIADALQGDVAVPPVYADGLGAGLVKRLGELSAPGGSAPHRGGLAPRQLRRVLDYLAANLAEDLPLDDMADVAGLSTSHFSRAFKATTGMPPHRWLLNARCERAKELLVGSDVPLAELALDVGFCDQAHFCRSFARVVGTSPGAWRREHA